MTKNEETLSELNFVMVQSKNSPLPSSAKDPDYSKIFARRMRLARKKSELLSKLNQMYPK